MYHLLKQKFVENSCYEPIFHLMLNETKFHKYKLKSYTKLLDDIFFTDHQKKDIETVFCGIQKFIHAMNKLKQLWLYKKTKIYNSEDLFMNPIHEKTKHAFILLQNHTKYIFHLRELINIINTSLSNSTHFFAEPNVCKNPYNNLPLSKCDLYNIYFSVRSSNYIMPTLFHKYFLCNFDLLQFSLQNEYLVNDEYLSSYVENNCCEHVVTIVKNMFYEYEYDKIRIHNDFPKDIMLKIMKPYLKLYYISQYSVNTPKKEYCTGLLERKLNEFYKYNPNFGRKKVKKVVGDNPFLKKKQFVVWFNDDHLPYVYEDTGEFMNSHLKKRGYHTIIYPTRRLNHHLRFNFNIEESSSSDEHIDSEDTVIQTNNNEIEANSNDDEIEEGEEFSEEEGEEGEEEEEEEEEEYYENNDRFSNEEETESDSEEEIESGPEE